MSQIKDRDGTDQTCYLVLRDGNGDPVALAYNSAGISIKYWRPGTSGPTAITPVTQTIGGAHVDGGFVHVEEGLHRLDVPDAAVDPNVREIFVMVKQAGIKSEWLRAQLSDFDPTLAPPTLQQTADGILDLSLIKGRSLRKWFSVAGSVLFGRNSGTATAPQLRSIDVAETNVLVTSNGDRTTLTVDWTNA